MTATYATPSDIPVFKAPYPNGEAGKRYSLEQTAQKASDARNHPVTRGWVMGVLKAAGNPVSQLDKAKAIHKAIIDKYVYAPDPIGTELITNPTLMMSNVIPGGDCDDLTACFLSAIMSIGILGATVGHAFGKSQEIDHVLPAVWVGTPDGTKGTWYYAEVSPDANGKNHTFGSWMVKPSRERVIAVPVQPHGYDVLCDADACLTGGGATRLAPAPWRGDGEFIGLGGLPAEDRAAMVLRPLSASLFFGAPARVGVGDVTGTVPGAATTVDGQANVAKNASWFSTSNSDFVAYITKVRDDLAESQASSKSAHDAMYAANAQIGSPMPQDASVSANAWTAGNETQYQTTQTECDFAINVLNQTLGGLRLAGVTDESNADVGFQALPGDSAALTADPLSPAAGGVTSGSGATVSYVAQGSLPAVGVGYSGVVVALVGIGAAALTLGICYLLMKDNTAQATVAQANVTETLAKCAASDNCTANMHQLLVDEQVTLPPDPAKTIAAAQGLIETAVVYGGATVGALGLAYVAYHLYQDKEIRHNVDEGARRASRRLAK